MALISVLTLFAAAKVADCAEGPLNAATADFGTIISETSEDYSRNEWALANHRLGTTLILLADRTSAREQAIAIFRDGEKAFQISAVRGSCRWP